MPRPLTSIGSCHVLVSVDVGTEEVLGILLPSLTSRPDPWLSRGEARSGPGAASISLGAWPDVTLWLTRSCTIHPRGGGGFLMLLGCLFTFVPRLRNSYGSSAQLSEGPFTDMHQDIVCAKRRLLVHVSDSKQSNVAQVGNTSGLP